MKAGFAIIDGTFGLNRCGPLILNTPADFHGAQIEIALIRRSAPADGSTLQTPEFRQFWESWFKTAGASSVHWSEIW